MTTVYEIRYSQNNGSAQDGPAIATLWNKPNPARVPSDCVVIAIEVSDSAAAEICE